MSITAGIALSLHIGLLGSYNSIHPYASYDNDKFIAGIYYNSVERISIYGGVKYKFSKDTSLELGLVSGYNDNVIPMAKLNHKQFYVMPAADEKVGIVIGIQF
jgi:predicted porin